MTQEESNAETDQTLPQGWYSRFKFYMGVAAIHQLPPDSGAEVAFAGRSNVGKSSVINKITHRRALAKTSKLPGRTRELNYFSYSEDTYIVDLPGYGYAKVNTAMQNTWAELLEFYLSKRTALKGVFLIMDIRHPPGKFDQRMIEYCRSCDLPLHILLNKADKLSRNATRQSMQSIQKQLKLDNANCQLFSALKGTGLAESRSQLAKWLFQEKKLPRSIVAGNEGIRGKLAQLERTGLSPAQGRKGKKFSNSR